MKERDEIVILAVEDEPLNRRLLHVVLEPAGYTIVDAPTLAEARERSREAAAATQLDGKQLRGDIAWRELARQTPGVPRARNGDAGAA